MKALRRFFYLAFAGSFAMRLSYFSVIMIGQVNLTRCKTERRKTHTTSCNRRDKNKISLPVQYYERRLDFLSCDDFIKQILHPI